jgi:hypothetical protein
MFESLDKNKRWVCRYCNGAVKRMVSGDIFTGSFGHYGCECGLMYHSVENLEEVTTEEDRKKEC